MNSTGDGRVITITSGTIIKTVVIFFIAGLVYFFRDILVIILAAIIIASAFEAPIQWFRRFRVPRTIAVLIIYLFCAALLAGLFYSFLPVILSDVADFLASLPQYIDTISLWNPLKSEAFPSAGGVAESLGLSGTFSLGDLIDDFNTAILSTSQGVLRFMFAIFGGLLSFILIVVLSFYFAVQEDGVTKFLRIVLPEKYENYVIDLWRRSQIKIGKWLQGQLLLGVLIGVLVYLGLSIFQVKNALLLAVLAGIFEIIPIFGPILSAIPAVIFAFMGQGLTIALIVTGYYILINQFENHVLYPLVVRKIVGIPPIIVIIALIMGFKLAGVLGILISVPLAAVVVEFLEDFEKRKRAIVNRPA
jgi:predicted PurR-regulated permease PerM